MILTKKLFIKMNFKHIEKYRLKGYICNNGDIVEIRIEDLSINSHMKILVKCDVCNKEKETKYQGYNKSFNNDGYYACSRTCGLSKQIKSNLEKYGVKNTTSLKLVQNKMKITCLEKFGNEYALGSIIIKEKIKNTCLNKYGSNNVFGNKIIGNKAIDTKIINGFINSSENKTEFEKYKNIVRKITKLYKKELFEKWNGLDFYDSEYIKDNFKYNYNNRLYPTIDHKISVFYGYINNINPEEIGNINNLCLTKKYINSSKNIKINY